MFQHLKYIDDTSDKFWEIQTSGTTLTITFGRNGTSGQSKVKTYDTEVECLRQAEKYITEKRKKGYSDTGIIDKLDSSTSPKQVHSAKSSKQEIIEKLNKIIESGDSKLIVPFLKEHAKGNVDVIKKQIRAAKKYWIDFVDFSKDPDFKTNQNNAWGRRGTKEQQWVIKLLAFATFNASDVNPWNELFDVIRNCSDPEVIEIYTYAKPRWINKFLLDNLRKNDWNYIEYQNLREAETLGMIEYDEELYAYSFNSNWNLKEEAFFDFIQNDALFFTRDFPLVFKYETNIQNIYWNFDYQSKVNVLLWNKIFDDALQQDKVDKRTILNNALEIQTKNWNTHLKSYFQKVIHRLDLKEEDIISHQLAIFPLLHSEQSVVVNFAVDLLKPVFRHPQFMLDEFLNWTEGFFMRNDCKGAIKTLLIQWDKILKTNPEFTSVVLMQSADLFIVQDLPLQERVAKLLLKYAPLENSALSDKLISYSSQMIGNINEQLQPIIKDASSAIDQSIEEQYQHSKHEYFYEPKDVLKLKEAYIYPENWNDILFKIGDAIGGNHTMELEILMNAWVMHQHAFPSDYKTQLQPYIKQIESKFKESQCYQHFSTVFLSHIIDPSKIYYNDNKYSNFSKWASTISECLIVCQQHIMNKVTLPLLCLPTHKPFWIDPEALILRVLAYEEQKVEINMTDLAIAINRTVRENLDNIPSLVSKIKDVQIQEVLNYALGFTSTIGVEKKAWYQKILPGSQSNHLAWMGIWANCARSYHHDKSFEEFVTQKEIPFAYQPYRVPLVVKPYYNNAYDYQTKKYTPVFVANKIQYSFPKCNDAMPTFFYSKDLFERKDKTYLNYYLYKDDFVYMHSLMPQNTESLSLWLNACVNTIADHSGKKPLGYLNEMLRDFFRFDTQATLFLACSLFAIEKEVRALAVEVLIHTIEERRLPVDELGKYIGELMTNSYGPIGRLHGVLIELKDISSLHHHAVLQILDQSFMHYTLASKMPTNFKKIVEIYYDLIHKENYKLSEDVYLSLENLLHYKSLQPIINKIIKN